MPLLRQSKGFTLVELSIVIAIIGLLIGGVMAGTAMLTAQRLRSVGVDVRNYRLAMEQFKQKYQYYPGDFPTATQIWGRADGNATVTSNCAAPLTAAAAVGTCNGNGDGIIWNTTSANAGMLSAPEGARAWQQMNLAGLLPLSTTGTASVNTAAVTNVAPNYYATTTFNLTAGALGPALNAVPGAMLIIDSGDGISSAAAGPWALSTPSYINYISVVFSGGTGNTYPGTAAAGPLASQDAQNIDQKYDDGVASTGFILGIGVAGATGCRNGSPLDYTRLGTAASGCGMLFLQPPTVSQQ